MMPIVRSFLDNEMYYKYDYLIEEACGAMGAICYALPWPKYLKTLEYYIGLLSKEVLNQKLVIKILVNILDAFHFDLSLSKQDDYFTNRKRVKVEGEEEDENEENNDEEEEQSKETLK